jgi:anti-sigma B factor antagonist
VAADDRREPPGILSLETASEAGVRTLRLGGELDLAGAPALEAAIEEAMADSESRLVIDFSALTFIDSTGIAILVAALGDERAAGRLGFVPSTAPAVTRVLRLTGVEERLPLA